MIPTIATSEIALRLLVAAVLCGLIGLERETRDRAAGIRTHILVGSGAALFTLVSAYGFSDFLAVSGSGGSQQRLVDPTRVAAQIVSGIGFLGAGVIIKQGLNARGVTTASSLWAVAAIGLAAGVGFYSGAVLMTTLALLALFGLRKLRPGMITRIKPNRGTLLLHVDDMGYIGEVLVMLHQRNIEVKNLVEEEDDEGYRVSMSLKQEPGVELSVPLKKMRALEGVIEAKLVDARHPGSWLGRD